ncbi:Late embryogenesis abundant protein LEA-2 subgroup domain-containing protein [Dioscorea alata]|uniref:Late embryogenesis abundant protein LEA-2 subgroup domain-containing protein n=1 Tax=Dioscorea alata TaxID=55571 RepID=A0ACB7URQ5_DIOAL|nr:Late embryogenesis abundant protein LEA-2 subgroup domain-containing protein [Dioscorea alata]
MHTKTDSEVTSLVLSTPTHSPPPSHHQPPYFVLSPSHPDIDKLSLPASSPPTSPPRHHRFAISSSPILDHSRESSSTTRFSASLKHISATTHWHKLPHFSPHYPSSSSSHSHLNDAGDDGDHYDSPLPAKCYVLLFILGFVFIFSLFSLILWAASQPYKPHISIKSVVIESYKVQAGVDLTGVPTKMLSIKSTVKIAFHNPATFFGVHVSSTPLQLYYSDLKIASGQMEEFYESRKSGRVVMVAVKGMQVPLYGGGSTLSSRGAGEASAEVPLNLTLVVRARANVLGELVKCKFYRHVWCSFVLKETRLGKPLHYVCRYHD